MAAEKKVTWLARTVVERGGKENWTTCGVAFQNRDGGFTVLCDAVPVNGKLVIVQHKDKPGRDR